MSSQKTITLDDAVKAARDLPEETQEALAKTLMDQIEDFATPERSPERQTIIKERVQQQLKAISRDELMAMLRQYDPAL
jgi:hypothetical protein